MAASTLVMFCICVAAATLTAAAPQAPVYTTKYDNLDVDKILASRRLVNNYVQCLTDKKPCSPEGAELKKILPDAIRTRCEKCNDVQKEKALKVVRKLQKDYPAEWKIVTSKWDPDGSLMKEFEKEYEKRGGKL
uniref:Chemosensory protein 14 n=1 Tax=Matsumurasca onukii TaxID=2912585 RepID=A0A343WH09_MATON|nr:chemosensory protein 14 [Matsumurasca onukii]